MLSVVFSLFSLVGWVFCTYPEPEISFRVSLKLPILLGVWALFFLFYKFIFAISLLFIDCIKKVCASQPQKKTLSFFVFEKHTFISIFSISAFVYGFWWFAFFPGTLHPDMTHHLYQSLGIQALNKTVPIFLTKVVGVIMTFSKVYFLSDNVGVLIYVAFEYVFQCFTVSYMFLLFRKMRTAFCIRWFALFYVYVIPVFSIWGVCFGKDTPYYLFMLLFICCMVDMIISDEIKQTNYLLFSIAILGVSLCRNNGLVMIVPALVLYIVVIKKDLKRFIPICLICLLVIIGLDKFFVMNYKLSDIPQRENMAVPIQTYVCYLREYGDTLDVEDIETIEMLFSSSPSELAEAYDPMISDPVKNRFLSLANEEQMDKFWTIWKKGFFECPLVFIRGFLSHSYGYFYPGQDCWENRTAIYTLDFHSEFFSFEYTWGNSPVRDKMIEYAEWVYRFPATNILYRPGVQMLILISLGVFVLKGKNKRYICVLVPGLMMIFVVFSPVNAYFRYMLPVFVTLPINISWAFFSENIKMSQ